MAEDKKKKVKMTITSYDPVEEPEMIIAGDPDNDRREAFRQANKLIMGIVPEYFINPTKRKKNSSSGGGGFTQNIVVSKDNATVNISETQHTQNDKDERIIGE